MNWANYPQFTAAEFRCKHTGKDGMQPEFMEVLQAIRSQLGQPMQITSGYRHPSHPVEARKGHSQGEHTRGLCADIACTSSAQRYRLVSMALRCGITRIGIAKNFVHLGLGGPGLPSQVIWEYL